MTSDLITVGARIQEARKKAGISQSALAEQLNISVPHLSNIENGKKTAGLDIFIGITKALGVSADELLDIVPEKTGNITTKDILALFSDCTEHEKKAMLNVTKEVKASLRNANE